MSHPTPIISRNPFVGLRPFNSQEALLFFGRRNQVVELLERLHHTRFLAVIGSSGSGKSSLVRAGLIPKLQAGMLVQDRDRWRIATCTPGTTPRIRLAAAIRAALRGTASARDDSLPKTHDLVKAIEFRGMTGLVETIQPVLRRTQANLLILVDQFEELFRFDADADGKEAAEAEDFVSILLDLTRLKSARAYVVITMRSDYLPDCEQFRGLPEALNRSQYLVPSLGRHELTEVIEGPIRLYGRTICNRLVDRMLNDLEKQEDRLPILQHALMKVWACINGTQKPIDLPDYIRVGALRAALSRDAEEVFQELNNTQRAHAQVIFRLLTDTDIRRRQVRRTPPPRLTEVEAVTGASRDDILEILNRFRADGRVFVRFAGNPTQKDARIDICHESLIRQWPRLKRWVAQEAQDRERYTALRKAADNYQQEMEDTWTGRMLDYALGWWQSVQPSEAWAERYGGKHDAVASFLDTCRKKRELKLEHEEQRRRLKMRVRLLSLLTPLLVVALATAMWSSVKLNEAQETKAQAEREARHARQERDRAETALKVLKLTSQAASITYSRDRTTLALLQERGSVLLLNVKTGESIGRVEPQEAVTLLALDPDGQQLVTVSGHLARIRNIPLTRNQTRRVEHSGKIRKITFSPDGKLLATASEDGSCRVWKADSGELVQDLSGFDAPFVDVRFSNEGQKLVGSSVDGLVVQWVSTDKTFEKIKTSAFLSKPEVLIHIAGEHGRARAAEVAEILKLKHYFVRDGLIRVRQTPKSLVVRYFKKCDEATAQALAQLIGPEDSLPKLTYVSGHEEKERQRPLPFELWFPEPTLDGPSDSGPFDIDYPELNEDEKVPRDPDPIRPHGP